MTADFFKKVARSASAVVDPAKDHWNRTRPYVTNPALTRACASPMVPRTPARTRPSPRSQPSSWPTVSGKGTRHLCPGRRVPAQPRIGGVHYPSDVEAGYLAGTVIAAFELDNPAFQLEFAQAKTEARRVLGLP